MIGKTFVMFRYANKEFDLKILYFFISKNPIQYLEPWFSTANIYLFSQDFQFLQTIFPEHQLILIYKT